MIYVNVKERINMIIALVSLYNPDKTVKKNILQISEQVDVVFLCDNSLQNNQDMFIQIPKVRYIFNGNNLALSSAFNKVLKNLSIFNWSDDDFVIFFDQDSSIKEGHVNRLICEYNFLYSQGYRVGCIGPMYFNRSINKLAIPRIKEKISQDSYIVKSIITSSMLTTYSALKKINFWNEKLFLDLADWDLCWRLMAKKYICVETKATILDHAVGSGYKRFAFFKVAQSSAIREYYQTKNCLYLLFKPYVPFKYKLGFIRNLFIRPILHYFIFEDGKKRLRYVFEGYKDYMKGYFGEYISKR